MPSLLKKSKAKLIQIRAIFARKTSHIRAIFTRRTSRLSSRNYIALPGASTANVPDVPNVVDIPNVPPSWKDDQQSQDNLLSTHRTCFEAQPVVITSKLTSSHTSESSPRLSSDPEPKTSDKLKKTLGVAWKGLETTLRLLEKSADVFPPLKSAVGGLVAILDLVEAVTENDDEYDKLATELTSMAKTLIPYVGALAAEGIGGGSVARIVESINAELIHIKQQQDRYTATRTITAIQDQEDVIKCYRVIESLFRQLQSDITLRTWDDVRKVRETGLLMNMSPVYEALYNSAYSTTIHRRGCTEKTREKVLEDLEGWVGNSSGAKIYWMNGIAGTGKTTISYTFCEWLKGKSQLGGNYFCSRTSVLCRNINNIIPTLAYQLAKYSHSFRSALCNILEEEPEAGKLNVEQQFQKLLRGPLQAVETAMPKNIVIVIDALDECDDGAAFRLFLDTLLDLAVNLPIKFFITSRPEPAIHGRMSAPNCSHSTLYLHDIEESIVAADIKKYLAEAFRCISPIPSSDEMEQLVKGAGNLFIYAATAVRYICPSDSDVDCEARLRTVLGVVSGSMDQYEDLDQLYTNILYAALNPLDKRRAADEKNRILLVLKTVVCAKEPMTTETMASLLSLEEKQVRLSLQPLRSVLHMQEGLKEKIAPFHASFPDFLFDKCRSKDEFHCNGSMHNEVLANHCFDLMKQDLRFNICNLESSFVFDKDVPDLAGRIKCSISPALSYACRYWGEHLLQGELTDTVHEKLVNFLKNQLLFWIEVLNLKRCLNKGVDILEQIGNQLRDRNLYPDTLKDLEDAQQFILNMVMPWESCIPSTPHIYIFGLAFCPRTSSVHKNYWRHMKGLTGIKRLDSSFIRGYSDSGVNSVTNSLTQSAFGSNDETTRGGDATRNMVAGPLNEYRDDVLSVAFSPDGTHIVSGSMDNTIRVWDAQNGNIIAGPFHGHTDSVWSVAFSPDGTRIVSGSDNHAIRVWDAQKGNMIVGPFHGHTDSVWSVAFSPDGTQIVSGSGDHTIRVWDAQNGNMVAGPFNGHTDSVWSVAFSPDGTQIVSCSGDHTIRVWDAQNGNMVAGPFLGHTGSVPSVAFSPDGTRIVSGSRDHTIRVWDVQNGNMVAGPFNGHTDDVQSVAFSPDGTQIVSGSMDNTIRVWDAQNGNMVAGPFNGHTGLVWSVAFSPDGTQIVSGSADHTIRVWDAHAGLMNNKLDHTPLSHSLFSGHVVSNLPAKQYTLRDSGWIAADNNPLLWVPYQFRSELLYAGNIFAITPRGVSPVIDFSNIFIGETWSQCYQ